MSVYEKDLAIDPDELDEAWLIQPVRYMKYAEMETEAKAEVNRLKNEIEVIKAQVDKDVRNNPDKYGLAKTTEPIVANAVIVNEKVQKKIIAYNEALYEANMLSAAGKALDHRKKALENLVHLYASQYFSGPKEPKQLKGGSRIDTEFSKSMKVKTLGKKTENQREQLNKNRRRKKD